MKILPQHIKSESDLVTSHNAVCDGFLLQALKKTEIAEPYIKDALQFWEELKKASNLNDLIKIDGIRNQLITAAGFSDKSQSHLSSQELIDSLKKVLDMIAEFSQDNWREQILYRNLLTKGDSLGGSMRNFTGALASIKFTGAALYALKAKNITPKITSSKGNPDKIQMIEWPGRIILFDKKSKITNTNIDVIYLDITGQKSELNYLLENRHIHIAMGELKGGIDPAGADEHWKTARSALERIRKSFKNNVPYLFFVGAAIERAMAKEIFDQLIDGRLTHAANLTSNKQLDDLVTWLISQ
ncbi:MAG: hypothetical protein A2161_02055 [Candidatus Schekmanbacteria bacterium RBG_13_48_7]|uniref:Restriction endonuclease n=1 Tax=Candidatus Schekmanbacteria bacterium RBG_13_48_7 TaxID=1817878 RepID=A0A1F7RY52_9BACT|nr:MAG: hypothetical protein A2161_02055 [Candidatus Schekmanbacteria bacterium RBG_13_48_7]